MRRVVLLAILLSLAFAALPRSARPASADCAFVGTPITYEGPADRSLYNTAIELAAYNMLFPGDPYFGTPAIEQGVRGSRTTSNAPVPPVLLKATAWIESVITQADSSVPFEGIGPALVSFDCGHGIMQVTSGMTVPLGENENPSPEQVLVATHFARNIARGAVILADKWNQAPENKPVAGTDTNGDPGIIENWYFAVWGYNGFTGPGADKSNHPMDPIYGSWPRTSYSCGPSNDGLGHNRSNYPYQELVFGCASHPPVIDGTPLWNAQPLDLPDLNDARWREPLKLENFVYPYDKMDIPTPRASSQVSVSPVTGGGTPLPSWFVVPRTPTQVVAPSPTPLPPTAVANPASGVIGHRDNTPRPSPEVRTTILRSPNLAVGGGSLQFRVEPEESVSSQSIRISNTGTGVLSWMATASADWLMVSPAAGVAVGEDMPCTSDDFCDRSPVVSIWPDPAKTPQGTQTATVRIEAPGLDQAYTVAVTVVSVVRIGVPGVARN